MIVTIILIININNKDNNWGDNKDYCNHVHTTGFVIMVITILVMVAGVRRK